MKAFKRQVSQHLRGMWRANQAEEAVEKLSNCVWHVWPSEVLPEDAWPQTVPKYITISTHTHTHKTESYIYMQRFLETDN